MKFFIDTANLSQIAQAAEMGIIDGVTTNPSLMAKEGITGNQHILEHYKSICDAVPGGDISAEVISTDFDGMIREAEILSQISPQIVIKIPMIPDGIRAIKYLSDRGIKTNCTLVFSAAQALLAAKAGATYVSPFIGRLEDVGADGVGLVAEIRQIYDNYNYSTRILAASIRNTRQVTASALIGADVVTAPLSILMDLAKHPLTDSGLEKFLSDAKKLNLQ